MIIRSEKELDKVIAEVESADKWAVDTEGTIKIYPNWHLTGISISTNGEDGYYIPVGHQEGTQLPAEYVTERLKPYFENDGKTLFMANSKFDMKVFRLIDPTINFSKSNAFCTMTASFTLNVDNEHGLKESALREFDHKMLTLDEIGCPKKKDPQIGDKVYFTDQMSIEDLAPYATDDAVQTYRLGVLYSEKIDSEDYNKIYYELEMPFMFILMKMEEAGIKLDKERLIEFMEDAPAKLEQLEKEIFDELPIDEPVNLLSNPQMNVVLFDKIGIKPRGKQLKSGGWSVTNDYLNLWSAGNPVCGKIADYRKLNKLFGNYLSNLYHRISSDGRIRCNFNRHVAATGRLSSSKPNLQNIPRPENDVYGLRKLFVAGEGKDLIVADYSQIELRLDAHLSQDPAMIKAFMDGEDVHSITAKNIFKLDCPASEVKDKYPIQRQVAKTINFGIIYEAGPTTLTAAANKYIKDEKDKVTEEYMKKAVDLWFRTYRGAERFIEICHQRAIKNGYVKTIIGRKRPILDAQIKPKTDDDHRRRYGAFRKASNTPVQGSAADVLAIAMRNIEDRFIEEGFGGKYDFVLQIHDEIVIETDEDITETCSVMVKKEMEKAVQLRVPLVADVAVGKVWGDIK